MFNLPKVINYYHIFPLIIKNSAIKIPSLFDKYICFVYY